MEASTCPSISCCVLDRLERGAVGVGGGRGKKVGGDGEGGRGEGEVRRGE